MKYFIQPRSPILREKNPSLTDISPSTSPISIKQRSNRKTKTFKENNAPAAAADLNSAASKLLKSQLPPKPPRPPKQIKRKLNVDAVGDSGGGSDSCVQVIVRMRPPIKDEEGGDLIVQKSSSDSVSVVGQTFTFDAVADVDSTQMDIFNLVGAPLVENCLAGFNSSVFAYGQTGSGKTYTIWGPANALMEENLSCDQQGMTPRVFERLFSRIDEEQSKHPEKELRYQCRCSYLEIYNEQITDLLEPSQRNLHIREDVKTGVYVENLREECVSTMKDVTQLLIKGMSNRRTGATSINADSSRSHSVFTCVVDSRCKSLKDGLGCFKSSRINLVDLAGSERQKLTQAAGECLKEAGNINRSLSQLGNLINILAEVSQTGKQRHIPYRDSKLTFLLQDSLGGNAKLAMVCAISRAQSCRSETFSTLRFAKRAKAIKNKAIVNEEMKDDVNVLREMIRQLKDELFLVKEKGNQTETIGGYSTGWNARRSLNLLKFSLNHPMILPRVDGDGDEEMEIVNAEQFGVLLAGIEEIDSMDNTELERVQLVQSIEEKGTFPTTGSREKYIDERINLEAAVTKKGSRESQKIISKIDCIEQPGSEDNDVKTDEGNSEQTDKHESLSIHCGESGSNMPNTKVQFRRVHHSEENSTNSLKIVEKNISEQPNTDCTVGNFLNEETLRKSVMDIHSSRSQVSADNAVEVRNFASNRSGECADPSNLSLVTCEVSPVLKSPVLSLSPRLSSSSGKNLRTSSTLAASQNDLRNSNLTPETVRLSFSKPSKGKFSNAQSIKRSTHYSGPSEHLEASLQRGLEILDSHRHSSGLRQSSYRFSYKPGDVKPILLVHKVDAGVQTIVQDNDIAEADQSIFLCCKCKNRNSQELRDANEYTNLQLVAVENESQLAENSVKQISKEVEKVLAGAIRREMALEEYCAKQSLEIMKLNRLIQQYKHERECNAIVGQTREEKIVRLESLIDGILRPGDFIDDELILRDKYDNHPELLGTKIELKRVRDELERYHNFYDMGLRDVLVEEVQDLRRQLHYYTDVSLKSSVKSSVLQLTYPHEQSMARSLCPIPNSSEEPTECKLEIERIQWTDAESKWISLTEELKVELESSRMLAEKHKAELGMEKKCSEELKVSMQMAMEGHARMIEQYADLQEKHMQLLERHRRIQDGIEDVKKAAAKAGVRGAELKFINTLAAEISTLKVEREKERWYLMDENKGLQAQLRDTAEAVQAAGELLVRLKEAEEAVATAQNQAAEAELETQKAYKQINKLKRKHEKDVSALNQLLEESCLPKRAADPVHDNSNTENCDALEQYTAAKQREEFTSVYTAEEDHTIGMPEPPAWFSGYDRCNV